MRNIETSIEFVTPEVAKSYLAKNTANRVIKKATVLKYADQIIKGNWVLSPEGISFDKNGNLLNGQHRLHAIIKAEKGIELMVLRGFEDHVFQVLDSGTNRTARDVFSIKGIANYQILASGIKYYFSYLNGNKNLRVNHTNLKTSNTEILKEYESKADLYQIISGRSQQFYRRLRLITTSEIFAVYSFLIIQKDYDIDMIDLFFEELHTYSEINSVNQLRERLIKDKTSNLKLKPSVKNALLIKAWNFFVKGDKKRNLTFNEAKDEYPEFI